MLTGERRWLSARRGGMTVLGKVTVPKPINLPSQRLENHGLDPNVEIVPKGTLNWGTRPSSSGQNAWTTTAQSPESVGTGSPSHLNGRPSSGGTGTRPSTAGSDKSNEPVSNAWGASSRPSSASGVVTSNQKPVTAARPRSAEPRPASSHLSRFAEPSSENSVTWGAPGTMEKLGVSSSKNKDFSLTSGDFPTLGSEKAAETLVRQGHSSQSRPVSASGRPATPKKKPDASPCEDGSVNANQDMGVGSTSESENVFEVEVGDSPSMEGWQREMMSYPNQHMPQQFGPWHGNPPQNPPSGVWYRGPFGGGPYPPQGVPGSYPQEPFGYYHPRLSARATSNLQPVLQPGSAPSGYFPEKGDSHRPHMPDSFIQPVVPFGPGPFPVQVRCDGYYGPPHMGSCIPGERRPPMIGMATTPCVYNRYPIQNTHPDSGNFRGPSGYGSSSTRTKEHGMSGRSHGPHQGPFKVLLKHQDGSDEADGKEKRGNSVSIDKDNLPGSNTRVIAQVVEQRRDDQVVVSKVASSQYADNLEYHSPAPEGLNIIPGRMSKGNTFDDGLVEKPEAMPVAGEDLQQLMSIKRNPSLIEKIETLNNKARISDGRYDERMKSLKAMSSKHEDAPYENSASMNNSSKAPTSGMLSTPICDGYITEKRVHEFGSAGPDVSSSLSESQTSVSVLNTSDAAGVIHYNVPTRPHVIQGRSDNRVKGKTSPPTKDEEWRKKTHVSEFSVDGSSKKDETFDGSFPDQHSALRVSEKSSGNQGKTTGNLSSFEPSDNQRAKIKEIVAERAKKLQKEEEQRTREQKARALAKLEELNRRTLAESTSEKAQHVLPQSQVSQNQQQEYFHITTKEILTNTNPEVANPVLGCDSDTTMQASACGTNQCEVLGVPIGDHNAQPDCTITNNYNSQLQEDDVKEAIDHKPSQGHESLALKQKQILPKRKQNSTKISNKLVRSGDSVQPKSHANLTGDLNSLSDESPAQAVTKFADDYSLKPKKRNSRSGKNKHKVEPVLSDAPKVVEPVLSDTPKVVPVDGDSVKPSNELNKLKKSVSVFEVGSVQVPFSIEITETQDSEIPAKDQGWSQPSEEVLSVANNQLKPQPRRMPKNTQAPRTAEKFHGGDSVVWAPVGSLKKVEASECSTFNSNIEVRISSGNSRVVQFNKGRRAEMERYVPKPVAQEAKELSVKGSNEQRVSSFGTQTTPTESTGMMESASLNSETCVPDNLSSGKVEIAVSNKTGEVKHNKHGKTHGLWRPRTSGESAALQPSPEETSHSSAPNKNSQKFLEQNKNSKAEISMTKEKTKDTDNLTTSDAPISKETLTDLGTMDHGVTSRGRRQSFKGRKGGGNVQTDRDQGELHQQNMFEDGSRMSHEINKIPEKRAAETHPPSHWQPKSQGHNASNDQGSSVPNGGQRVPNRVGKGPKREYPIQRGEHHVLRNDKSCQTFDQLPLDKSNEQRPSMKWIPNVHHESSRPERKVDSNVVESKDLFQNVNNQHEGHFMASRRQFQQNRFNRVHEVPHGTQNPGVQDLTSSCERSRHDSQNEYQKGRSIVNDRNDSWVEGPRVTGSRYRERGQTHYRRGGPESYARNSGYSVVATASPNREPNPDARVSIT